MVGVALGVVVEHRIVIGVGIHASRRLAIAPGQGCEARFHAAIITRAQPLGPQPVLMLEVRADRCAGVARRGVISHRLAAPIVPALVRRLRRWIPLRDALPARVEDKLCRHRADRRAHSLIQRVVNVARRRAAAHRRDVAFGIVCVLIDSDGICGFPPLSQNARQGWGTRATRRRRITASFFPTSLTALRR